MRLLVTNTHSQQAYSIIRALKPHAERIVATLSGRPPLGFWPADHAAYSRFVDARYRVPDPEQDWLVGRIQETNTNLEDVFVKRILEICAKEKIDTIFPSSDAWVYVFSKNKALFEAENILIPVPDLPTVMTPLDKYLTLRAAGEVGFPCPATHLAESDEDVRRIASELDPPWVIKLRFTTGSRGMAFVESRDELLEKCRETRARHGPPLVQEYIPGQASTSFHVVLDRDKRVIAATKSRALRRTHMLTGQVQSASEIVPIGPIEEKAIALGQHINWWGGYTLQYKLDPRDGQPKLMEINPRLGIKLWYRTELGINEPMMCLQIARGEKVDPVENYPYGCLILKPFEDLVLLPLDLVNLAAYRFRTEVLKRHVMDPLVSQLSMENRFGRYWSDYFGKRDRRVDPYFRYAAEDPMPLVMWTSKLAASALDGFGRSLGRRVSSLVSTKAAEAHQT